MNKTPVSVTKQKENKTPPRHGQDGDIACGLCELTVSVHWTLAPAMVAREVGQLQGYRSGKQTIKKALSLARDDNAWILVKCRDYDQLSRSADQLVCLIYFNYQHPPNAAPPHTNSPQDTVPGRSFTLSTRGVDDEGACEPGEPVNSCSFSSAPCGLSIAGSEDVA